MENVEATAGQGVAGCVEGVEVKVGRPDRLRSDGEPVPALFRDAIARYSADGHTLVPVSMEGKAGLGVCGFLWGVRSGQCEDVETPAPSILPDANEGDTVDEESATHELRSGS